MRHPIFDRPPIKARVDEYRRYSGRCSAFGEIDADVQVKRRPAGFADMPVLRQDPPEVVMPVLLAAVQPEATDDLEGFAIHDEDARGATQVPSGCEPSGLNMTPKPQFSAGACIASLAVLAKRYNVTAATARECQGREAMWERSRCPHTLSAAGRSREIGMPWQ